MIRRRLLAVPVAAGLVLSMWTVDPVGAATTSLNELCKDSAIQEAVGATAGVPANHGQCQKALLEASTIPVICRDPGVQETVAEFAGTSTNFGQCRKALTDLVFGG